MIDEETRRAILAELVQAAQGDTLRPYEFTVRQYADAAGMSYDVASRALRRMERAGDLRTRLVRHGGKQVSAYWRYEDGPV